jgi:hypothetical protein
MTNHTQNSVDRTPGAPTAQELISGEVDSLVSLWPDVRDDDELAPSEAMHLLAVWAHLHRFVPETINEEVTPTIQQLIENDVRRIVERFAEGPFPDTWCATADELDEAWDNTIDDTAIAELERESRDLFDLLDRFGLALYAAHKLAERSTDEARLSETEERVRQAEQYLATYPDRFLPAATYATALLEAYRPDLDSFDEQLWRTTLKHRRLQELLDERDSPSPLPRLDQAALAEARANCNLAGESVSSGAVQVPRFVEICLSGVPGSVHEISPHFAQALQEPLDETSTSEAPLRRWEPMRIEAKDLQWLSGSNDMHMQSRVAEINVEWDEAGFLLVLTHGLFRRGDGYSLHVRWFNAQGKLKDEAKTHPDDPRAPLMLKPGDLAAPKAGDQLTVRHVWTPDEGEGWNVTATIQF